MKFKILKPLIAFLISLTFSNDICSQEASNSNTIKLVDFLPSTCDDNYVVEAIRNRISRIEFKSDTLLLDIAIIENCAYGMEPVLGFANLHNDTLYLEYIQKREYEAKQNDDDIFSLVAFCDCCFEFKYVISGIKKSHASQICVNGEYMTYHPTKFNDRFYDIPFDSVAHSDTLNLIDYLGYRQGKWIWYQNGRLKADFDYHDNEINKGQWFQYFSNGEVKENYSWYTQDSLVLREYDTLRKLITKQRIKILDNGFGEIDYLFSIEEIDSIKTNYNNVLREKQVFNHKNQPQ